MDELRELDVRIAEALGICITLRHDGDPCQSIATAKYTDGEWFFGESLFKPILHYSTDIATAWELIERMRLDGWFVLIELPSLRQESWSYTRLVLRHVVKMTRITSQGSIAPEAICRAFLTVMNDTRAEEG